MLPLRHKLNNNINTLFDKMNGASTSSSSFSEDELPAPQLNTYQHQRLFGTVTRAPKNQYHRINWRHHVDENVAEWHIQPLLSNKFTFIQQACEAAGNSNQSQTVIAFY
jgi:hypothetical protein